MIIIDPLSAAVKLLDVFKKSKRAIAWMQLLGSMFFSALIAFLGAGGLALMDGHGLLWSLGAGMLAAALSLLSLFTVSPLTRGMMVSVPKKVVEAHQEQDTDQVVIRHGDTKTQR